MSLPVYIVKINGAYYAGIDHDAPSEAKTSHMGWQPRDIELTPLKLVDSENEAYKVEGNINLRSILDKVYDRVRYGGFTLESLEVRRMRE